MIFLATKLIENAGYLESEEEIKRANRTSHRYNYLPLLPSGPGGVQ